MKKIFALFILLLGYKSFSQIQKYEPQYASFDFGKKNYGSRNKGNIDSLEILKPYKNFKGLDTLVVVEDSIYYLFRRRPFLFKGKTPKYYKIFDEKGNQLDYKSLLAKDSKLKNQKKASKEAIESFLRDSDLTKSENQAIYLDKKNNYDALVNLEKESKNKIDSLVDFISFRTGQANVFVPFVYSFSKRRKYIASIFNNYYYGKNDLAALQSITVSHGSGVTNLSTEIASGFFGTHRIALIANINENQNPDSAEADKNKTDAQRFLANGGQAAFSITNPLIFIKNPSERFHLVISMQLKSAFDAFPSGQENDALQFNQQVGGNLFFDFISDENTIGLFAELPFAYVFGNKRFYDQFNYRDFSLAQISFGLTVYKQMRIKFTGPLLSSQKTLQSLPYKVGIEITPP